LSKIVNLTTSARIVAEQYASVVKDLKRHNDAIKKYQESKNKIKASENENQRCKFERQNRVDAKYAKKG